MRCRTARNAALWRPDIKVWTSGSAPAPGAGAGGLDTSTFTAERPCHNAGSSTNVKKTSLRLDTTGEKHRATARLPSAE